MALKFECDRCKTLNGADQVNDIRWIDGQTELVAQGHLCIPCWDGLEQIITHYMTDLNVIPEPAPATVDVPDTIPEGWNPQ